MVEPSTEETAFHYEVTVRGMGDWQKLAPQKTIALCRALYAEFGERAQLRIWPEGVSVLPMGRGVRFDPLAAEGGLILNADELFGPGEVYNAD